MNATNANWTINSVYLCHPRIYTFSSIRAKITNLKGNISGANQPLGANCANQTHLMMWESLFENIQGEVGGLF
jgi:hypothetical protein